MKQQHQQQLSDLHSTPLASSLPVQLPPLVRKSHSSLLKCPPLLASRRTASVQDNIKSGTTQYNVQYQVSPRKKLPALVTLSPRKLIEKHGDISICSHRTIHAERQVAKKCEQEAAEGEDEHQPLPQTLTPASTPDLADPRTLVKTLSKSDCKEAFLNLLYRFRFGVHDNSYLVYITEEENEGQLEAMEKDKKFYQAQFEVFHDKYLERHYKCRKIAFFKPNNNYIIRRRKTI